MSEPPSGATVLVESDVEGIDTARWAELARQVLVAEGITQGELGLSFVDVEMIGALKAAHLDGDGSPTDVLAFPLDVGQPPGAGHPGGPVLLGDVVVCPAVAAEQASANRGCRAGHDGSFEAELALLVVHGVLHVCGWDHDDEPRSAAMWRRETELLEQQW